MPLPLDVVLYALTLVALVPVARHRSRRSVSYGATIVGASPARPSNQGYRPPEYPEYGGLARR